MKTRELAVGFAAGVVLAGVTAAGIVHAQADGTAAPPTPVTLPKPTVHTPGSVQVTRLTDTTFVVVKDQGDAQVVTLFTTESGLVQKKHAGRFLY